MTKTALITGASRGLGAALAQELCDSHHIIAVAKTTGALEELDDRIQARGGSATLAPMDITNNDAMATLCRGIYDRWGNLDLWLHTAIHAAPLAPSDHIDGKDMAKSVATNITATSTLITYIAPLLGHSGQAVFFDDPVVGTSFYGSYGATKAAQIALARSWQSETASIGPKVSILTPAPMPTATRARFHPGEDRDALNSPQSQAAVILAQLKEVMG
ncbi:MAG: SDR family oxidoreductase [Sulfitobacter sp.]|jgi:NAD(P)-dependent dehydrogenase (short-subunit alcohol dehydrogenase family)|uniref:SDR family NAD(P)-dependent oxidoreductase n=1 Tax=Sulfitobacter sp. TaxID=1903071 RepID=UPI000C11CBB1|nr:oxidoreductase [Roseobacter sp.]MBV50177.1 oxidoreductase [Roseobacter sp.]PHR05462.1 MAG: oxidoreductase [Sulfitobacter sp.]|tara:strand:- start:207 stop:857 length:651 start_codon:yes stop_codon:yes gene_type:complete